MRLIDSLFLAAALFFTQGVYAEVVINPYPLNMVNLQLSTEQWVTTQTANVTVVMDANLNQAGLALAHQQIMANLVKIAKDADWHITVFERSKDQADLETLHVEAQARLPENQLAGLRDKAQAVTQPAARYSIGNIDFAPSFAEIEQAKIAMHAQIYAAAKVELAALNKEYSDQHYFLHTINFTSSIVPGPIMMKTMVMGAGAANAEAASFATSNKLTLTANVVFASTQNVQAVLAK